MVIQGSVAFVWNTLILWWRTFAMRFLWFLGWEGHALLSLAVWCGLGEGFGEDLSFPWVHDQYDSYDTVWPTHTSRRPSKLQAWRNSLVSSVEWRSESHALMILSNVTCTEFSRILTDSHGFSRLHGRGSHLQLHGGSSGDGLFDPEGHWRLLIISYMLFGEWFDEGMTVENSNGIPVRASHRREESCFKTPLIVLCKDIG